MAKKTLLVGDIHCQGWRIYPRIYELVDSLNVQRVILLGDYFDQWGTGKSSQLYVDELSRLEKLKTDLEIKGIEVILLIGNHDVPYLTFRPMSYSLMKISDFYRLGEALWMLKPQIAYQLDEYLVSHAGYTEHFQLEEWHLKPVTYEHKDNLLLLNQ